MINNSFNLAGIVVAVYDEKLDNNLQIFEIEVDKPNYESVILPVLFGEFTKGNIRKGDKVIIEGCIDLIDKKVCAIALQITNLVEWKKKQTM